MIEAAIEHLLEKWNQPEFIPRWYYRGWLCGYAIAEIVMTVFSGGISTAIKNAGKAGKFSKLLARFPKIAKLAAKVEKLDGDEIRRLKAALKGSQALIEARQWAARVLKIPVSILQDLTLEAIERLKRLSRWSQDMFSQLNHRAMRRVLGCASPCEVDLEAIEGYLKGLAATDSANARKLTSLDDVIEALPEEFNFGKFPEKFKSGEIIKIITRFELTDLDFKKMRDFLPVGTSPAAGDSYNAFTKYLSALAPIKTGPDLNKFVNSVDDLKGSAGRALRGSMFENFVKLHIPEFKNLIKANFPDKKYKDGRVQADFFNPSTGTIWECKYQSTKLSRKTREKYIRVIGKTSMEGNDIAERVHFLFPTEQFAAQNYEEIAKLANHSVYYVKQVPNQAIQLIEYQQ